MKIIEGTTDFHLEQETAVAIGKFDGVHIGHQRLLEEILEQKKKGLQACVFTFDPSPAVVFGLTDNKVLTTREEKRILFEKMGIDILIEFPLTQKTAAILPELFVSDILVKQMKVKWIAAGEDLSFGAKGAGNAQLLQEMAFQFGFEVKIIQKVYFNGEEVSSSFVRKQVEKGNMELVRMLLGHSYMITGSVVHGNRIGRTLGFPTVNLIPKKEKLLPPRGVYSSEVYYQGKRYQAISNIGYKPTVTSEHMLGIETYLYDFHMEIYGEFLEVYLNGFKRPEQQFENLEALKTQLMLDIKE